MRHIKCSSYVSTVFEPKPQKLAVKELCRLMYDKRFSDVNCIVGCGVSGTVLASIVANKVGKQVVIVRKNERSHATYTVEGVPTCEPVKYVVIDDLVASGDTIRRITEGMRQESLDSQFVGLLLYHHSVFSKTEKVKYKTRDCLGEEVEREKNARLFGVRPSDETDITTYRGVAPQYVAGFHIQWDAVKRDYIVSNDPLG